MANTLLQITRKPPKASAQFKVVRDEVRVGLLRVGKRTEAAYNQVVGNWERKPIFKAEVGSGTKQLFVRIRVTGTRRNIQNWNRIDKTGAQPHVITPKRGKYLRFFWGGPGSYRAKTGARPARFGGSGTVAGGRFVYRTFVNHPGFKARKFSEQINKRARPILIKEIRNGYVRGMRRAAKG